MRRTAEEYEAAVAAAMASLPQHPARSTGTARAASSVTTLTPAVSRTSTADPVPEPRTEPLRPPPAEPADRLVGYTEPRIFTPPLRMLTRETSLGYAVADFADQVLGRPLLPWQRWAVIHALELLPDGHLRFRTVLILVARQNGKSDLSRVMALFKLYMLNVALVLGTAQDLDIARRMLEMTNELIDTVPFLAKQKLKYITANGKEHILLTNKRQYVVKATNDKAGRSLTVDHVTLDELREHKNWGAWGALTKTTNARPDGQVWCFSNAGDESSIVLNQLQANAQSGRSSSVFLAEWSAEDGCALDDREGWKRANPALGYLISVEALQSALDTDPPDVFRTECLCQRVASLDGAVNLPAWRDSTDAMGNVQPTGRLVVSVDVSPDQLHVSLIGASATDDGRSKVEALAAWDSIAEAVEQLETYLQALKPYRLVWLPAGPAAAMGTELKAIAKRVRGMKLVELTGSDVTAACQEFAAQVAAYQILHSGDALLEGQVAGAKKLNTGDGWRFIRRGVGHVDAVYAAAAAVLILRGLPARSTAKLVV